MGGYMNLNPLKQDNNTDALVKALQDASNTGSSDTAITDGAAIAADPQVATAGATPPINEPVNDSGSLPTEAVNEPVTKPTDTTSGIAFDGNDLPVGLSNDANAHLTSDNSNDDEIDTVKKSALEQLRPLIEKLDLNPIDKFDKYLMMLRASDDPTLIKPAFDAAQGIEGEKEKAQALLDIINEINYITASQQQNEQS